jgi:hypothetical protein
MIKRMTNTQVQNIIIDNIEASTSAINALMNEETYDPDYGDRELCKRLVAKAMKSGIVPLPKDHPSSRACIAYGLAIAAHIVLTKK